MTTDKQSIPAPMHNQPHHPENGQMVWVVLEVADLYREETWVHSVWTTKEQADTTAASLVSTWSPDGSTYVAGSVSCHYLDSTVIVDEPADASA